MTKVKIGSKLYQRAKKAAEAAGYSSFEEFLDSIIENELMRLEETKEADDAIDDQLRGLGYLE
jgi:hypothetical protein